MLLFARPGDRARIRDALHSLIHVPFKCEFGGSRIIFHDPEEDFSRQWQERDERPPACSA